jgi:hypothetical protein
MELSFGALCDPLKIQLKHNSKDVKYFQKLSDAITTLRIRNYIPDSIADKAYKKLADEIMDYMRQRTGTNKDGE